MYRKKLMTSAAGAVCALALSAGAANAQDAGSNVLHPFYGDISPFYGDISPFYGDISPFWGDISPFWGDISPFWGDISPFYGDISPFWGDIAPFWGDISPFMRDLQTLPDGSDPDAALRELYERSNLFWGAAVEAQTGAAFDQFAQDVFARYGLSLDDDGEGFGELSDVDRARFLFDWYDGLMAFSGRDHVDYWMRTANWSPALARSAGGGQGVVIGVVDFTVSPDSVNMDEVLWWRGENLTGFSHGDAVASLLTAPHDGRGVMGIAPNATIAAFNPFDETGTASWDMLAAGVNSAYSAGASVINMSLGVPGYTFHPGWGAFYARSSVSGSTTNWIGQTTTYLNSTYDLSMEVRNYAPVFVHAAGNEGVAQTANIDWNFAANASIIVVGSVGPTGVISPFSNTPGTACLMNNGVCQVRLMDRFIVAPGEWILTSDGEGGVMRQSGTSFAAPLVSGAVALLQGRWGWLKNYPHETADVLFRTARDLGAPGIDPVYGRGMLDIAASQAPISMNNLYQRTADGTRVNLTTSGTGGALLGVQDGYVTVFEDVGATYRDFRMPLTSGLSTVNTAPVTLATTTTTTSTSKTKRRRFADEFSAQVANPFGWDMRMSLSPLEAGTHLRDGELPYAIDMMLAGDYVTLFAGRGQGALALDSQSGFGASSYTLDGGGANPILGLASGGGYVATEVSLGSGLSLAAGFTQREAQVYEADFFTGEERPMFEEFASYRSAAAHALLRQTITDGFSVSASYTYLREENGMLGLQSANPDDFAAGTETDAATFGLEWAANDRFGLSLSATYGRMREGGSQSLTISEEGANVSAFEVAFDFNGVFGRDDFAQLRFAQPLRVESGSLDVTSIEVVDRETGELGAVTQRVQLGGGGRQYLVEGAYATPLFEGQGEFGMFVRLDASEAGVEPVEEVVGARFNLNF